MFVFGSFRLDVANASLQRGKQTILLRPKTLNLLHYLVEHAGQLVTKDELWRAVWPEVSVTDAALTVCVSEIRKALGDDPKTPRYLETAHRLGYRFIGPVSTEPARVWNSGILGQEFDRAGGLPSPSSPFVGRQAEMTELHKWLERALVGERQIVFVTGEPGIGKTTLVEEFLRREQVSRDKSLWIGRGQCIEHYGTGEAYLPIFDALARLCRAPERGRLLKILEAYAPSWLIHMPSFLGAARRQELQGKGAGATQARMLRELAEAVEVFTAERPLILCLEDLHWSDYSTLEWLGFLARRQEAARLLVLGTYRPVEVIVREHPLKNLKQELQIHGQCRELALALLSEAAVREYLTVRFPSAVGPDSSSAPDRAKALAQERLQTLSHTIHQRTEGNPLFMVNVVDYLLENNSLINAAQIEPPPTIRQMIEYNLERLDANEQRILEAASIAGAEFSAAAVAAALEQSVPDVETACASLARRAQFIHANGAVNWPDGTVAAGFRFDHALYEEVLYGRVTLGRRIELHGRIAERLESAFSEHCLEIAAELARHFSYTNDQHRAINYFVLAGEQAVQRAAHREAVTHLRAALQIVEGLPASSERDARELELRQAIVSMFIITSGFSAPETIGAADRASALAEKCGNPSQLADLTVSRAYIALSLGDLPAAATLANQAVDLAARAGISIGSIYGLQIQTRYWRGDLIGVEQYFNSGQEFFESTAVIQLRGGAAGAFGAASWNAWMLGRAEIARERIAKMLARVDENNPYQVAFSAVAAAHLRTYLREYQHAERLAAGALNLCEKHQFSLFAALARCLLGHARAQLGNPTEGIGLIRRALNDVLKLGSRLGLTQKTTYLAAAQECKGRIPDALETIEQALRANPDELVCRPETLRIRGELWLKRRQTELAEVDFCEAIALAQKMGAKAYELRATMSLARLLALTGRREQAHDVLADVYNWFTEGFDTADLKEAKDLLEELAE